MEEVVPRNAPARILVGNTFPLSLVRRRAVIQPKGLPEFQARAAAGVVSFWGHPSTLSAASAFAGLDLTPARERPALRLSADLLPVLDGEVFRECWMLSPDFTPGFRPALGEEVRPDQITGWQILRLTFPDEA